LDTLFLFESLLPWRALDLRCSPRDLIGELTFFLNFFLRLLCSSNAVICLRRDEEKNRKEVLKRIVNCTYVFDEKLYDNISPDDTVVSL